MLTNQQIYKSRGFGEQPGSIRAEYPILYGPIAGKRSCVKKCRQIVAVIDVQMGQQHYIYLPKINLQFSDAYKRARPDIQQNPRLPINEYDVTRSGPAECSRSA